MYRYSKHFIERMRERNITEAEILALLNNEEENVKLKSKHDKECKLIFGFISSRGIVIVINEKNKVLVTTRPMKQKEKIKIKEILKGERQ